MSTERAEREALLRDLVAGARSADDPAVRLLLAGSPDAVRELAELRALSAALDRADLEERDDLREALAQVGVDGASGVETTLRALARASASDAAHRRRRTRWLVGSAAAAAILVVIALRPWRERSEPPNDQGTITIGASELELLAPIGPTAAFELFEWQGELDSGGWYRLLIRDPQAGPFAAPLLDLDHLTEARCQTRTGTAAGWPTEIAWEVQVYDSTGLLQASKRQRARREEP